MTQDNPYSALLDELRRDTRERAAPAWRLGLVTSVSPLAVRCGGLELSGADLLVNTQLLPNAEQVTLSEVSGTLDASADCPTGSVSKLTATGGSLAAFGRFGGVLAPGDTVAMLRDAEAQQFVILCKVVGV